MYLIISINYIYSNHECISSNNIIINFKIIIIILIISISSPNYAAISYNYEIAKDKNSNSLIDNCIFFFMLSHLVKENSSRIFIYLKYAKAVHEEAFFIIFVLFKIIKLN